MNETTIKRACQSKKHCKNCRNSEANRKACGFPEICPYGYTKDNLPDIKQNKKPIKKLNSISKIQIDYCPHFEKPCCTRKTGMCKITKEKCTTNGIIRCDRVKE